MITVVFHLKPTPQLSTIRLLKTYTQTNEIGHYPLRGKPRASLAAFSLHRLLRKSTNAYVDKRNALLLLITPSVRHTFIPHGTSRGG
jgi:hypothetical protein